MVFWSGVFSILFLKFNSKSFVWFLGGLHTENQNCHIVCKSVWNRRWVNIVSFFGNKNLATWPWVLLKFRVALILCGLTGDRAKHFLGLIVELLPWLFSFTFSLSHLLFLLIFSYFSFVHGVHFYGKGLGKTFRITELAGLKIFKCKIFIETFGSTVCQFSSGLFDWIMLIQVVSPCTSLMSKFFMTV